MNQSESWQRAVVAVVLREMGVKSAHDCRKILQPLLPEPALGAFERQFGDVTPGEAAPLDSLAPTAVRRAAGMYFTPTALADRLANIAVEVSEQGVVADLSCGDGELLAAVLRRAPGAAVYGVERELVFAVAAAARIARIRKDPRDRVIWGDGLTQRPGGFTAIVGNPPYVGEKGNRALFAATREAHPHLHPFFGPRLDLHYLFIHQGLEVLRPGGRLVYLTSEYWLTASGAQALRTDLGARGDDLAFERLGAGEFKSAPGHHSLIFSARRRPTPVAADGATWHPFATQPQPVEGDCLSELCRDRQGFVSGADRVTARLAEKLAGTRAGAPIYIWRADELPAGQAELFRPLLRRSDCVANRVYLRPPARDFVLWSDGNEDRSTAKKVEALLEVYRPLLEARREVVSGTMPWRRIWWPRRAEDYARPKLVVPRRSKTAAMCLDLTGSYVSSDCTFLLAPKDVDAIPWLLRIMFAANSESAITQLRSFGKNKGDIMEFYSAPLKSWRLGLARYGSDLRLLDDQEELRCREALELLSRASERAHLDLNP